jgi:kynurenine/2-aminoadipate aminotransferase
MKEGELTTALQYSSSYGLPDLVEWLRERQRLDHRPPYESEEQWRVCVTSGSQHGLYKAFSMLLDEGDTIFVEDPTYTGALAILRPLNVNIVGRLLRSR